MGNQVRLTVPERLDGVRLDRALADLLGVSRSTARSLVDLGVTVAGVPGRPNTRLATGDVVVGPPPPRPDGLQPEPVDFEVRYEDESVVVVDKPGGVVVHPGAGSRTGTLAAGLLHRYPELEGVGVPGRWGLVHRLDRDTSGALLVARDQGTYDALVSQLRERKVQRKYLALIEGTLHPPTGTIEAPIGPDPDHPTRRAVVRDGKWARTHYRAERNFEEERVALVEVSLETGRTHQIRVHFAAIGHPVVADPVYGSNRTHTLSPRIFLHAAALTFEHPATGRELSVAAPLPADLRDVLASLDPGSEGSE